MCRDGFRAKCQRCGEEVTCRDDYPEHEWRDCEPPLVVTTLTEADVAMIEQAMRPVDYIDVPYQVEDSE